MSCVCSFPRRCSASLVRGETLQLPSCPGVRSTRAGSWSAPGSELNASGSKPNMPAAAVGALCVHDCCEESRLHEESSRTHATRPAAHSRSLHRLGKAATFHRKSLPLLRRRESFTFWTLAPTLASYISRVVDDCLHPYE